MSVSDGGSSVRLEQTSAMIEVQYLFLAKTFLTDEAPQLRYDNGPFMCFYNVNVTCFTRGLWDRSWD